MADALGAPLVAVVGMVGGEVFGADARRAIADADVILGSARHLAHVAPPAGTELVELAGSLDPLIELVAARRNDGRRVCVLSSGDPGFFGITRLLAVRLGSGALRIEPAPSSVSLAWAAAGLSWDDADVVSAHGRSLAQAIPSAARSPKVAILTAPSTPPERVGAALIDAGCGPREVVVASRLGEDDQAIVHTDLAGLAAGTFDPMSVVLLIAPAARPGMPSISWGRSEHEFAHRDGMITKAEVRAVALGALELPRAGVLWDVGAGSGSVGLEAATISPGLRVYAIERSAADAANIEHNAAVAGVAVDVVVGAAPDALSALPDPDRVFVGGGGPAVVEACWARVRPGGTLVATFAVLEHAVTARRLLGEMVQLRVDRAVPIGDAGIRFEPLNPVFVCWGTRPAEDAEATTAAPASAASEASPEPAPRAALASGDERASPAPLASKTSAPASAASEASLEPAPRAALASRRERVSPAPLASVIVGIGMSSSATAAEVAELLDLALMFIGADRSAVVAVATRAAFADDPRLPQGIAVEVVDDEELVAASEPPDRVSGVPARVAATAAELVGRRRWGTTAMLVPTQRSAHATVAVCGKDQP